MEFNIPFNWIQFNNYSIKGTIGKTSDTKILVDGINKSGLCVGTFLFPHYGEFSDHNIDNKINLFTSDVNKYLLENCNNVDDVINMMSKLNIKKITIDNIMLSVHWMACDTSGKCIVLEVKNKVLQYYNNTLYVITNSPTFPEQLKNQKKYNYLSKYNKPDSISEGTGALGMPGDSSSKSRFVRAAFFVKNLVPAINIDQGLKRIITLLHNFDIPIGSVVNSKTNDQEVAQYTVAYSLNNFQIQYAPYGYIKKNNEWYNTSKPVLDIKNVKIQNYSYKIITILILVCILIKYCFMKN